MKRINEEGGESICKPGSVEDNHSSRSYVTVKFKQPTQVQSGLTIELLFGLAPDGVYLAIISFLKQESG